MNKEGNSKLHNAGRNKWPRSSAARFRMHDRCNIPRNSADSGPKGPPTKDQIPIQLGTKGSKTQINYGMKVCIKYGFMKQITTLTS